MGEMFGIPIEGICLLSNAAACNSESSGTIYFSRSFLYVTPLSQKAPSFLFSPSALLKHVERKSLPTETNSHL